jgi:hypothetical protein
MRDVDERTVRGDVSGGKPSKHSYIPSAEAHWSETTHLAVYTVAQL